MNFTTDMILNHSAIVITSDHDIRAHCWAKYIEAFGSHRLCEILHDGHLPQDDEVVPGSIVSNDGTPFLFQFSSRGNKLHVTVRLIDGNLAEILLTDHELIFLPKADKKVKEAVDVLNTLIAGMNFEYQLAIC